MTKLKTYCWNVFVALDQLANTLLFGDPDETISSRMGKHVAKNRCMLCKRICWVLNKIDYGHCAKSIESDRGERNVIN
jgi:hypothetical protein